MANEITATASVNVARGACSMLRTYTKTIDQATADAKASVLTVSGDAAVSFGLVATGLVWMQNISSNGIAIEFGPDVAAAIHPVGELLPGEIAMFRMDPSESLRVSTTGGLGTLYYLALDA